MAARVGKLSSLCWETFDRLSTPQKQELLQPYLQIREPIRRFSDIQKGDHLVRKFKRETISSLPGSLHSLLEFEHHFLCIDRSNEDKPVIIHYYIFTKDAVGSGGGAGKVQVMTLPHRDFIKNEEELQRLGAEIERVVWPVQLWRYSVEEVISRAQLREGEQRYDLTQNNCENFVMWCICGANVSLQATPKRRAWWEVVKALRHVPQYAAVSVITACFPVTIFLGIQVGEIDTVDITPSCGFPVPLTCIFLISTTTGTAIMRTHFAIESCRKELVDGVITMQEYQKRRTDVILSTLFRTGGCCMGMIITEQLSLDQFILQVLGAYSGMAFGHLVGKIAGHYNFFQLRTSCHSTENNDHQPTENNDLDNVDVKIRDRQLKFFCVCLCTATIPFMISIAMLTTGSSCHTTIQIFA